MDGKSGWDKGGDDGGGDCFYGDGMKPKFRILKTLNFSNCHGDRRVLYVNT